MEVLDSVNNLIEIGQKEDRTWYQCNKCYILLNNLAQFTVHIENHKIHLKNPLLFQTNTGLWTILTLPRKDSRVIFTPKIRLVRLESTQQDNARLDIVLPSLILSRVDDSVHIGSKGDSNLSVSNEESLDPPQQNKVKVQKRTDFRGRCWYCQNDLGWMTMKSHLPKCRKRPTFFCPECSNSLPTAATLSAHIALYHKSQKEYKCTVCSKHFATLRAVTKHTRDTTCKRKFDKMKKIEENTTLPVEVAASEDTLPHTVNKPLVSSTPCQNCGRPTPDYRMDKHFKICSSRTVPVFPCLYSCPANFKTKEDLADHVRLFHKSEPQYKCEFCEKRFTVLYALQRHLTRTCLPKQSNGNGRRADLDVDTSLSLDVNASLSLDVNSSLSLSCPYCEKKFITRRKRYEHLRRTRCLLKQPELFAKLSSKCKICDETFLTIRHLRDHLKRKTCMSVHQVSTSTTNNLESTTILPNADPFTCQPCGKRFLKLKYLRRHVRSCCSSLISNGSTSYPKIQKSLWRNKKHRRSTDHDPGEDSRSDDPATAIKIETDSIATESYQSPVVTEVKREDDDIKLFLVN